MVAKLHLAKKGQQIYKTEDQGTRTPVKSWVNLCVLEGLAAPAPHVIYGQCVLYQLAFSEELL